MGRLTTRSRSLAMVTASAAVVGVAGLWPSSEPQPAPQRHDIAGGRCPADPAPATSPASFDGDQLLVLSDADMAASAFMDGKLNPGGRAPEGGTDALTALDLPLDIGVPRAPAPDSAGVVSGETEVENSVIGPPYGIGVSPNGQRAYVLRTRGSAPEGVDEVDNVFADLPRTAVVSTVDISDPGAPRVIQETVVGELAHTLSLSPDGRFLAVNTDQPGRNIVVRRVEPNGPVGPEVAALSAVPGEQPVRRVGRIEWHPSGRFLAHGIPFEDEIRFHEFRETSGGVEIRPWGEPVRVGKFPDEGAFTPDGRFYLSTDLQWGDDVDGLFYDPPPGTITAVRFDAERGRHRVTGRARTDVSPEGIAVSPDSRFVVTGNLTSSWMPWNDERMTPGGSMNLLQLHPRSGRLTTLQRVPLTGVLPEGVTFDASGDHVAVTNFDHYDPRVRRSTVQFFSLNRGACPALVPTNVELEVPAGAHALWLVR